MCDIFLYANTTWADIHSGASFDHGFECLECEDTHEYASESMTNCTMRNVTLDSIPVSAGHWRQNAASMSVRRCSYPSACRGGVLAGDGSCATGHHGPLCSLCVASPPHYGGRHGPCFPCSDTGDMDVLMGVVSGLFVTGLLLLSIVYVKNRQLVESSKKKARLKFGLDKKPSMKRLGSSQRLFVARAGRRPRLSCQKRMFAFAASNQERMLAFAASLQVKIRVLISMLQVLSEVVDSYQIRWPISFEAAIGWFGGLLPDVSITPFGCVFPALDTFLFDFVVVTLTPLVVVALLVVAYRWLNARAERLQASGGEKAGATSRSLASLCGGSWCGAQIAISQHSCHCSHL